MTTLLFLPGNMCDARMWSGVTDELSDLDLAYSFADLRGDDRIAAMATRSLARSSGSIVGIGYSMGAIVALDMYRQAPHRVKGLVLLDVNAGADLPERAAARPGQQGKVRAGALEDIVRDQLIPLYFSPASASRPELRELVVSMALDLGADTFIAQSEALRTRNDLRTMLPAIECPVLLLCGEEDRLCPPSWHEQWKASIGRAELEVVEEAGHMLPIEQPEIVANLIRNWLGRHGLAQTRTPLGAFPSNHLSRSRT
ncbi:alpha/beta hydrolase [Nostoc sp. 3335mG]|nr:alpha/beta hydrolase [Nostoc sp. 3335mG]